MCRDNVGMFFNCPGVHIEKVNYLLTVKLEGPYYAFGNRGVYDIRHPSKVSGGQSALYGWRWPRNQSSEEHESPD